MTMMIQAEPQSAIVPQIQDISQTISDAIQQQRTFFATNQTKNIDFRIAQLQKLRKAIEEHEPEIFEALQQDLGKHYMESFGTEVGLVYAELDHCIANLRQWAKDKKVPTPMFHFKAESFVQYEPYGIVLIIGPWNYPFQLSLLPLVGAIAAGNCAILKPSELASHTAAVTRHIIEKVFTPKFVTLFEGGPDVAQALLKNKFDYIFFTGSTSVGKIVYKAAAEHLTPVTLELGGKSPCLVDKTADVDLSAKRIAWGKFLNVGQTCIAPDYILVHESVKDLLIERLKKYITDFYGQNPRQSAYYGKIINERNFKRLQHLVNSSSGKVVFGGDFSITSLHISPTIIDNPGLADAIMQEEIFGPILPIITYSNLATAIEEVKKRPKPLALYVFSRSSEIQRKVLQEISSGSACINDTVAQFANSNMSFGGVGESGIGGYHGKSTFEAFSHAKSVMSKSLIIDPPLRYLPFKMNLTTLKLLFKKLV